MSVLNPSASELAAWLDVITRGLPTNALAERMALSCLEAAFRQQVEMGNVLAKELVGARTKIAKLGAFENSVASLVEEAREPKPAPIAPSSPPRLEVVRSEP